MNLIEKQKVFPVLLARFFNELRSLGYEFTLGEAYRPPETAKIYQQEGKGISQSNHCIKLALDLNLFMKGAFLRKLDDYREAGKVWESYSTPEYTCIWGGHFDDADHFSLEHNGIK